ncbi:MAG: hypothetical protein ACRDMH_05555 [Solirubrobacterales bacterium]
MSGADKPSPPPRGLVRLLPLACVVSAVILGVSERMTTFQLVAGAQGNGASLCNLEAAERHHYALAVLAAFAILAVIVAVLGASRPAAVAVPIAGLLALLLFGIVDLPKANDVGSISGVCDLADLGIDAKAVPEAGFWLEMVGAVALTLSGAALAMLNSLQLRALRPRWHGGPGQGSKKRRAQEARTRAD